LSPEERKELTDVIMDHKCLFADVPNRTTAAFHDVDESVHGIDMVLFQVDEQIVELEFVVARV